MLRCVCVLSFMLFLCSPSISGANRGFQHEFRDESIHASAGGSHNPDQSGVDVSLPSPYVRYIDQSYGAGQSTAHMQNSAGTFIKIGETLLSVVPTVMSAVSHMTEGTKLASLVVNGIYSLKYTGDYFVDCIPGYGCNLTCSKEVPKKLRIPKFIKSWSIYSASGFALSYYLWGGDLSLYFNIGFSALSTISSLIEQGYEMGIIKAEEDQVVLNPV